MYCYEETFERGAPIECFEITASENGYSHAKRKLVAIAQRRKQSGFPHRRGWPSLIASPRGLKILVFMTMPKGRCRSSCSASPEIPAIVTCHLRKGAAHLFSAAAAAGGVVAAQTAEGILRDEPVGCVQIWFCQGECLGKIGCLCVANR
jgi:hypothetical protein